jgi:gag-polyprotein putative aspartyl protease
VLPFRSIHSLILVDAKVNGNPATLLLDTGANNTIINAKMYGNVQAPGIEAVSKGPGIVGHALRLRVDLEIAGRFLFSQPVSVMNLDDLPKRVGAQFDGLLGQDILRQFHSVRINYRARVIELEK